MASPKGRAATPRVFRAASALAMAASFSRCCARLMFLVLLSNALLLGFAIPRRAVDADVEDRTTPEGWEKELLGEGFGEGLRRALRLGAQIFLRDGLEGCSVVSMGVHHVDHQQELVGDLVGKGMDVPHLIGELAPQGILVVSGGVSEAER